LSRTDPVSLLTLLIVSRVCACACGAERMKFPIACLLVSTVLLCRHVGVVLAQPPANDACAAAILISPGAVAPGVTIAGTNVGATAVDASSPLTACTSAAGKSQPREPFPPARSHVTDVFATC
jgi:hypothetical protein